MPYRRSQPQPAWKFALALFIAMLWLAFLIILRSTPGKAEDVTNVWVKVNLCQQRAWDGSCAYYRQSYVRRQVYRPAVRYYAAPRRDWDDDRSRDRWGQDCRDIRRVVGDQHLTVDGARKAANDAWAGTVRFHLGEKFMSLENARRVVYTCSRSSIKEGGVTTLGQTLTRCEIEAEPCAAMKKSGDE